MVVLDRSGRAGGHGTATHLRKSPIPAKLAVMGQHLAKRKMRVGLKMDLPAIQTTLRNAPRVWVEICNDVTESVNWKHGDNLSAKVTSAHKLMLEPKRGDAVVHIVTGPRGIISGVSTVKINRGNKRGFYFIEFSGFNSLNIPIKEFKVKYHQSLRQLLMNKPKNFPFISGRGKSISLARQYLKEATGRLVALLIDATSTLIRENIRVDRPIDDNDNALNRRYARPEYDALNDIGVDHSLHFQLLVSRYERDPAVRRAVIARANGKCELCGELGFTCMGGTPYLEAHHIIWLAEDGPDRPTNVIALCPRHHREAHFGERHRELEREMLEKIRQIVGRSAS